MKKKDLEKILENLGKTEDDFEGDFIEWLECPFCGMPFDIEDEDELSIHMENCEKRPLFEEQKEALTEAIQSEKTKIENIKANIKKNILAESTKRQVRQFEQNPEALEEQARKELFRMALKNPLLATEQNEQLFIGLREKAESEVMEDLRKGFCNICNMSYGSEQGLIAHLSKQASLGEENHRKLKEYIDMVLTKDVDRLKEYYSKYPYYGYKYYGYEYSPEFSFVCEVCGQKFKTREEFSRHWAREHQEKYGVHKESLADYKKREELRKKRELMFLAQALLRRKGE